MVEMLDTNQMEGRRFPAGRLGKTLVAPNAFDAVGFRSGWIELDPETGQVPWHNHTQREIYIILDGENVEFALEGEAPVYLKTGQTVRIPSGKYHQLTNRSGRKATFLYIYEGDGDVAHWRQELDGTLPKAGVGDVPPLPEGAFRQCPISTQNSPSW